MRRKRLPNFVTDIVSQRIRLHLKHQQIAEVGDGIGHEFHHIFAGIALLVQKPKRTGSFATQNPADEIGHYLFASEPKNIEHVFFRHFFTTKRDQLVEHRFRIPHSAFGAARDRMCSCRGQRDFLFLSDELQMLRDQIAGYAV